MEGLSECEVGIVEREELMVSLSGDGEPNMRVAHFLQPTITSIDGDVFHLPAHCLSSIPLNFEPKKWPLKLTFRGCRVPGEDWKIWVRKMASLHESTWRKAGIYEAILNSTYSIRRYNDLVLGLAEKWCPETKSFIFSWGEATITLEDMMVCGYSVLGSSVLSPLETDEQKSKAKELNQTITELGRSTSKNACCAKWKKKFKDGGSEIEHEAFLAYWLSRFVFPNSNVIGRTIFPIAIHLARGTRIALAPAVLAAIYRDLSLLKEKIVALAKLGITCEDGGIALVIIIRAPLQLVQVWVWERFIELRPKPNLIKIGEPRFAQWHNAILRVENVRSVLDSANESFDWRPYTKTLNNWKFPKFYTENEVRVAVGSSLCEELESFAQCLRISELVGRGCVEHYFPHRVAMQFGLDQDLPACVTQVSDYSKAISYDNLYVPSRLYEADVTTRYLEWWKETIFHQQGASEGIMLRTFMNSKIIRKKRSKTTKRVNHFEEGVNFSSYKIKTIKTIETSTEEKEVREASASSGSPFKTLPLSVIELKELNNSPFPPGFPPKPNQVEARDTTKEHNLTTTRLLISSKRHDQVGNAQLGDCQHLSDHGQKFSSSKAVTDVDEFLAPLTELIEKINQNGSTKSRLDTAMEDAAGSNTGGPSHNMGRNQGVEGDGNEYATEIGLQLEDRTLMLRTFMNSKKIRKKRSKTAKRVNHFEEGVSFSSYKIKTIKTIETSMEEKEVREASASSGSPSKTLPLSVIELKELNNSPFPPGFPPKPNQVEARDTTKEHNLTTTRWLISSKRHDQVGNAQLGDCQHSSDHGQKFSPSKAVTDVDEFLAPLTELIEKFNQNGSTKSRLDTALEDATGSKTGCPSHNMDRNQSVEGHGNEYATEMEELHLEDRVSKLERIFAELKAGRFGHR